MPTVERRNISARASIVHRVTEGVLSNPGITLTVETMQEWLGIPAEGAQRILNQLAASGVVREVQKGVWTLGTRHGAQRRWS